MIDKSKNITPVLQASNLGHSYGKKRVLSGINLRISSGEIIGLLGPNGAGKTTTIRLLSGLLKCKQGEINLLGHDIANWPMYKRARAGLGYLPQETSVFRQLTTYQNLELVLEENGWKKSDRGQRISELLERFGLSSLADSKAETLSGGERRRLEIARAISIKPEILLFDEPFSGIDPISVEKLQKDLVELAAQGIGILITDHNIAGTLKICHHAVILEDGNFLIEGSPEELIKSDLAKERYLGKDFVLDSFRKHAKMVPIATKSEDSV